MDGVSTNLEWNFQILCTIFGLLFFFWIWISHKFLDVWWFLLATSFDLHVLDIEVDQMTCREQHLEPLRSCEPTSCLVNRICWNYVKFIRYRLIKKDEDRVRFTVWPTWLFVPNMFFHVLSHVSMGLLVFVSVLEILRQVMASMMELYRNELLVQVKQQKMQKAQWNKNPWWNNHHETSCFHPMLKMRHIFDLCVLAKNLLWIRYFRDLLEVWT